MVQKKKRIKREKSRQKLIEIYTVGRKGFWDADPKIKKHINNQVIFTQMSGKSDKAKSFIKEKSLTVKRLDSVYIEVCGRFLGPMSWCKKDKT